MKVDARRAWWSSTTVALIALATVLSGSRAWQSAAFVFVWGGVVLVTIAASKRQRIGRRLAVGLGVLGVVECWADLLRSFGGDHPRAMVWAEVAGLVATLITIVTVGMIAMHRPGRDVGAILVDGGIVAIGGWLLSWITIVRPTLDRYHSDPLLTALRTSRESAATIVIFLLVVAVCSGRVRTPSVLLSSTAITVWLVEALLRGVHDAGRIGDPSRIGTALGTIVAGLVVAAILHPSVGSLTTSTTPGPQPLITGRIAATAAALVGPTVVAASTTHHDAGDRLVRMISVATLALLVIARTIQAARSNRMVQSELLHSARIDPLTGLPNRTLLLDVLTATLRDAWKGDDQPTLIFIDLDRFKNINDTMGHAAGDEVLCAVAGRLRRAAPERATVARISGDEFVVLDPGSSSLPDAMGLADCLLRQFREPVELETSELEVYVTASIGVARLETQSQPDADVLLRHADTAMYQAKESGRNTVALFDETKNERASQRLSVETALFRAMDRDELRLHYQPILETTRGEVVGFEALMRWQQADGTIVPPAEFIPIAEQTGTIVKMGAWALAEGMRQLRSWIDAGVCSPTTNMSVNVSPRQLADPQFSHAVNDALLQARVSPSLMWLEVTEGIMITEPDIALATLRRLRSLGVRIAIDDFGTGYSSLSSLQKFPLQRIKIDRAFVQGVANNTNDRSLVRTIIAMGHSLGLDMVAEGVETMDQLQVLVELGCTKAQGYLISRPIPPDEMRSTISELQQMGGWDPPHAGERSGGTPAVAEPQLVGVTRMSTDQRNAG